MEYDKLLEYIYQRYSGNVKLGLDRMHKVMDIMGNPNMKLKGFHVGGTNGKGSTCATLEALALEQGFTTGFNSSPHLVEYMERFRINGKNITYDEILETYKKWEDIIEETEASFFEITTSMAFYLFAKKQLDVAIFEVGLGGRLDGTKPFNSTVTAITSIALDHVKSLGGTIEKIAYEKAGIIKNKVPVVTGNIVPEALEVIERKATEMNAPIFRYNKEYTVSNIRLDADGTHFDYSFPHLGVELKDMMINLLGEHQAFNAAVALTCYLLYLEKIGKAWDEKILRTGLNKVNWQGRMQILSREPLVILDGAHNKEGLTFLIKNLKEIFPGKKFKFITAILRDKPYDFMLNTMAEVAESFTISQSKSQRSALVEDLIPVVENTDIPFQTNISLSDAVKRLIDEAKDGDIIIVCGSLYTVAEVLKEKDNL